MGQSSIRFNLWGLLVFVTVLCLFLALGGKTANAFGGSPVVATAVLVSVFGTSLALTVLGLACVRASMAHHEPGWVNGLIFGVIVLAIGLTLVVALLVMFLLALISGPPGTPTRVIECFSGWEGSR